MIKVTRHTREFEAVKKEGKIFGKYRSAIENYGDFFIYIEYLRSWGDNQKYVKVWSFGKNKNFVTQEAVPFKDRKKAIEAIKARAS